MFFPSLVQDYLTLAAKQQPEKVALICGAERWTYSAIDQTSDQLASAFIELGVRRQDRVVVFLDSSAESVISLYGILKANGVFVIVNGDLKARKLAYVLKDSGAKILITHINKTRVVEDAFHDLDSKPHIIWKGDSDSIPKNWINISESWDSIFQTSSVTVQSSFNSNIKARTIDLDLAALIYTSGSTGEPKGVMSTHRNMLSAARSIIQYLENTKHDIILNVLPLSFDYGLYQVLMSVIFGGTVVLEKSFLYIHSILAKIAQENITGFPIVPTILAMLLKLQDLTKYNFDSLRYISNTGAALPVEHIRKLRALFPNVQIFSMFGLTECKRVCYLPPKDIDKHPDSVGIPMPNCEVFVVDDSGQEVKPGEVGELVIRGSNVMQGYWKAPELTAKFYKPGNNNGETLLYSGDYFRRDEEGYLYFLGRKDDMIKCKGERVSAREVENLICEIEGVIEVAVVGIPDDILGQAIKAFIVKDHDSVTEKDVLKFCTENLEPFAVPKYIEFVDALPKTPHAKIDKKLLKSLV